MPERFSSRLILFAATSLTLQQLAFVIQMSQAADLTPQIWGDWSTWSICSRHCGGGVSKRTRICLSIGDDDYMEGSITPKMDACPGDSEQYKSCNTQACSKEEAKTDFRELQCSLFNSKEHNGTYYDWLPYTSYDSDSINLCALNCYPDGEDFFMTLSESVIDGTSCTDDVGHPAVCVDGTCLATGCDGLIGSTLTYDRCGVCGGNGSFCFPVEGNFQRSVKVRSYYVVAVLPEGATNINVQQVRPTKSHIDVAANRTIINGNWTVDPPGIYHIAGTVFNYKRQSVPMRQHTEDSLYAQGPITNTLVILMMVWGKGDQIHAFNFSYTRPNEDIGLDITVPPTYEHPFLGTVYRKPNYQSEKPRKNVVPPKGETSRNNTNNVLHKPQWVEGPFSSCSQSCGTGFKVAQYQCQLGIYILDDSACMELDKPADKTKDCRTYDCPPSWEVGTWSNCSKTCGGGVRRRKVECWQKPAAGPIKQIPDKLCMSVQPATKESCNVEKCWKGWWKAHKWQECNNTCGSGYQRRHVHCLSLATDERLSDTNCNPRTQPTRRQPCYSRKTCNSQWYTGKWSACHAKCGMGVQNRNVSCYGTLTGKLEDLTKLPNSFCDHLENGHATKPCKPKPFVPCPPDWVVGNWSQCSKTCATTRRPRNRRANCMQNGKLASSGCNDAYQHRTVKCMYNSKPAPGQCDTAKPYEYKPCSSLPFCSKCVDKKPNICQLVKHPHFQDSKLCSHPQNQQNCCKTCHELNEKQRQ